MGAVSAAWLAEAGIADAKALQRLGPVAAYRRVKAMRPRAASLNLLDALAGAMLDLPFNRLPAEIKAALRAELAAPPPARRPKR